MSQMMDLLQFSSGTVFDGTLVDGIFGAKAALATAIINKKPADVQLTDWIDEIKSRWLAKYDQQSPPDLESISPNSAKVFELRDHSEEPFELQWQAPPLKTDDPQRHLLLAISDLTNLSNLFDREQPVQSKDRLLANVKIVCDTATKRLDYWNQRHPAQSDESMNSPTDDLVMDGLCKIYAILIGIELPAELRVLVTNDCFHFCLNMVETIARSTTNSNRRKMHQYRIRILLALNKAVVLETAEDMFAGGCTPITQMSVAIMDCLTLQLERIVFKCCNANVTDMDEESFMLLGNVYPLLEAIDTLRQDWFDAVELNHMRKQTVAITVDHEIQSAAMSGFLMPTFHAVEKMKEFFGRLNKCQMQCSNSHMIIKNLIYKHNYEFNQLYMLLLLQ